MCKYCEKASIQQAIDTYFEDYDFDVFNGIAIGFDNLGDSAYFVNGFKFDADAEKVKRNHELKRFNYCPMCGRKLEEEDLTL